MSSLLSKLKTLLSSSVRGPRRYKRTPAPPSETERGKPPLPEVTEAPARQRKLPEVAEAPQAEGSVESITVPAATTSRPASRVEEPRADEKQADTLEEERVVDLLKGNGS